MRKKPLTNKTIVTKLLKRMEGFATVEAEGKWAEPRAVRERNGFTIALFCHGFRFTMMDIEYDGTKDSLEIFKKEHLAYACKVIDAIRNPDLIPTLMGTELNDVLVRKLK